jgi:hypothetical protein
LHVAEVILDREPLLARPAEGLTRPPQADKHACFDRRDRAHIGRKINHEQLSNREIAERLFVSHRTVGSHLYRLFPKLGIVARSELGAALADLAPSA